MKTRMTKKLSLHKETVRNLRPSELTRVAGGNVPVYLCAQTKSCSGMICPARARDISFAGCCGDSVAMCSDTH